MKNDSYGGGISYNAAITMLKMVVMAAFRLLNPNILFIFAS